MNGPKWTVLWEEILGKQRNKFRRIHQVTVGYVEQCSEVFTTTCWAPVGHQLGTSRAPVKHLTWWCEKTSERRVGFIQYSLILFRLEKKNLKKGDRLDGHSHYPQIRGFSKEFGRRPCFPLGRGKILLFLVKEVGGGIFVHFYPNFSDTYFLTVRKFKDDK